MKRIALSFLAFSLAAGAFAAELPPINKVINTANTVSQEIQKQLDSSAVTEEIGRSLPTKEQTEGFLSGVWKVLWSIVKFIARVFDWILKIVTGFFYTVLNKIGLDFFHQ